MVVCPTADVETVRERDLEPRRQRLRSHAPVLSCELVCGLFQFPMCALAGEGGGGLSSRGFFTVRVELTEEGNTRVPEVIELCFLPVFLLLRAAMRKCSLSAVLTP